jgi:hypothetical protein
LDKVLKLIQEMPEANYTVAIKTLLTNIDEIKLFDAMIERQMNSFLVSFVNFHNNKYQRKGGLFQKPFKRIEVLDDSHLQQAIIYVNANAQKHQMVKDFTKYPFSSYSDIVRRNETFVAANQVINFFGNIEVLMATHQNQVDYYYNSKWPSSKLE